MGLFRHTKDFSSGVRLPGKKELSRDAAIEIPPLPDRVIIPLWQHAGAPATPCVALGATVKTGQRIGEPGAGVSAPVHASISGTVSAIDEMTLPGGKRSAAITIESDGRDDRAFFDPIDDWERIGAPLLLDRIDQAGVVGLGGAAFPARVKLSVPPGKTADILLVNGCECEPYLTADYRLMLERAAEAVTGIRILLRVLGVKKAIIGVERHSGPAIHALKKAIGKNSDISVTALRVKYPQGAEKILIRSILGREVPSGGLPIDTGVIVHNIGTAEAVYKAVCIGQPLIDRIVTISGEAIVHPKNLLVRIGTRIHDLVEVCGGTTGEKISLLAGGPMMGVPLDTFDLPITKSMSGIVVLPYREAPEIDDIVCINCGRCITACPLGLRPSDLSELGKQDLLNEAQRAGVLDCMHCGLCTALCPGGRRNTENIRTLKETILKKKKT